MKIKRSLSSETHKYAHFCVKSAAFSDMSKNLFASVTFQFHSEAVQVSSPDHTEPPGSISCGSFYDGCQSSAVLFSPDFTILPPSAARAPKTQ
jgi:hypothetical protein